MGPLLLIIVAQKILMDSYLRADGIEKDRLETEQQRIEQLLD
jgi:hypothetical protein